MGQLTPVVDPTGKLTQEQINASNINNLMTENNKALDINTAQFIFSSQSLTINNGSSNFLIIGLLPDGTYGMMTLKPTAIGNGSNPIDVAWKVNGGTFYFYDNNGINYMQIGTLPDASQGLVVAKPGVDVTTVF